MIAGHYLAQGEKLYLDIFSHKQPMPAVFSGLINKILKPNSLFLLIKRHREAVFFYSLCWWLIFLLDFGWTGLIFTVMIEFSKRFLLGDLFLGESLVIYPLVYVLGCLWGMGWLELPLNRWQQILFLFSLILIPSQLFALIPFSAIVFFYLLLKEKQKNKIICLSLLIFTFFLLIFSPFVSYQDYFFNTKAAISTHYLKDTVNKGFYQQFLLSFLRPVTVFLSFPKGNFGRFVWILNGLYFLTFCYLFLKKKKKKFLIFTFFLLGTISLRPEQPSATFYGGFHIFPWLACLIFLIILQMKRVILKWKKGKKKVLVILSICFLALFFLCSSNFLIKDYFRQTDRQGEFWINFSRFLGLGRVIKTLSVEGDRLIVIPIEQLIYFESELPHQNRFLYTYEWIFRNEKLRREIKEDLETNPPAFVYYDYASVGDDAKEVLDPTFTDYLQLRQNDLPSNLLIRKDKASNLEDWQIQGLARFGFSLPK